MKYRILNKKELTKDVFSAFIRRQDVTKCWRKISGEWEIKDIPFIDDWNESEYEELICGLLTTLEIDMQTYRIFMFHGIFVGMGLGAFCLVWQKNGPQRTEQRNCIFQHILLLRVKRFITQWGVWKRQNTIRHM